MAETMSCSGDEYTDDDEDGEELDPRVHDELERLNVAANSVNHLEAELDEARAVFRQTLAAATYHLDDQTKKVGLKNINKARPFYDLLRVMRKAHFELQKASRQYEKANSRHVYARQRVHDAEYKVFSSGEKRDFDAAMQEMLNQATIEVNEAENQKKDSWLTHQKMYKAYQDVEKQAKEMQSKLKRSIEKSRLRQPEDPVEYFLLDENHLPSTFLRACVEEMDRRHLVFVVPAQLELLEKAETWHI